MKITRTDRILFVVDLSTWCVVFAVADGSLAWRIFVAIVAAVGFHLVAIAVAVVRMWFHLRSIDESVKCKGRMFPGGAP